MTPPADADKTGEGPKKWEEALKETLEWLDKHAGWEYGFSVEELERIKSRAREALPPKDGR